MKKLFLLLLLISCTNASNPILVVNDNISDDDTPDYGSYLAAEYASLNAHPSMAISFLEKTLKNDGENETLIKNAYTLYAINNDIKTANIYAKKALKDNPDFFIPAYINISVDISNRDFDDGLKTISFMKDASLNLYIKPFVTAWLYVGKGDFEKAYKEIVVLEKEQVFSAIYNFNVALIAEMEKDYNKARDHYIKALTNTSGLSLTAVKLIGKRLKDFGETELSANISEKYREINFLINDSVDISYENSPSISIEYAIAELYVGLASIIPATDVYNRDFSTIFYNLSLYLYPDFTLAKIYLADTLSQNKDIEDSNLIYSSITKDDEYFLASRLKLAGNYAKSGDIEKAKETYYELAEKYPKIIEPYMEMGDIYRLKGDFANAKDAYTLAINRADKKSNIYWALLYSRGITFERMKMWKEGEADLKEALNINPNNPYILNYLGYCWIDRAINLDTAFAMIKKAYVQLPNDGNIADSLAWSYYLAGDYETALNYMETALTLEPSNSIINDHLGDIYWEMKRRNEARYQWKKALELNQDLEEKDRINIEKKLKYGKAKNVPKFKIEEIKPEIKKEPAKPQKPVKKAPSKENNDSKK